MNPVSLNQKEVKQLLQTIQHHLDEKRSVTGMGLKVQKDGYAQDDGWLQVVVTPVEKGIRTYDYVEALNKAERELRREGIQNVILVPALAD